MGGFAQHPLVSWRRHAPGGHLPLGPPGRQRDAAPLPPQGAAAGEALRHLLGRLRHGRWRPWEAHAGCPRPEALGAWRPRLPPPPQRFAIPRARGGGPCWGRRPAAPRRCPGAPRGCPDLSSHATPDRGDGWRHPGAWGGPRVPDGGGSQRGGPPRQWPCHAGSPNRLALQASARLAASGGRWPRGLRKSGRAAQPSSNGRGGAPSAATPHKALWLG